MTRELPLHVDATLGRRAGVEHALRDAIHRGRLRTGDELPSTRALAADLGVSRATVVGAYEQLAVEGYVVAEQGRSTRVAHGGAPIEVADDPSPFGPPMAHDFRPGQPDVSAFPRRELQRSMRRVISEAPDEIFGYPDPRGRLELRTALAAYLGRARAVVTEPSAVTIVGGFSAAIAFVGELLVRRHADRVDRAGRRPGAPRIAVEDPMLFLHRQLLRLVGVECVPIRVDEHGLRVDELDGLDVDAALVCPAHQYPMGGTLPPDRRADLIAWSRDSGAWIVEDDYDGEFRYDRRPVGALQGLAPDRVVYIGTASKTLAPGLRIAWMTVPADLRTELMRTVHTRAGVSSIDQLAFADFLERGCLDGHVRAVRPRYRARRDAIRERLAALDWLAVPDHAAGLHITARFVGPGRELDEADVERTCAERSVGVIGLRRHYHGGHGAVQPPTRGLVLGFANPPEHHFRTALDELVSALWAAFVATVR